jgi:hypothetical protein
MLGSWKLHNSLREQIKNIKINRPHPKGGGSGRSGLPQKAATGWL